MAESLVTKQWKDDYFSTVIAFAEPFFSVAYLKLWDPSRNLDHVQIQ